MRIEDDDIIRILQEEGPSSVSYVVYRLGPVNRERMGNKMKSLAKYRILERLALDGMYIYRIPGDKRPANIEVPKEPTTARGKFDAYIRQIPTGAEINALEVADRFHCRPDYAREIIRRNPSLKATQRRYRGHVVHVKGPDYEI